MIKINLMKLCLILNNLIKITNKLFMINFFELMNKKKMILVSISKTNIIQNNFFFMMIISCAMIISLTRDPKPWLILLILRQTIKWYEK